jgi:hypothetical protein
MTDGDEPSAKARGPKLGNDAKTRKAIADRGTAIGNAANAARAAQRLVDLKPMIRDIIRNGKTTPTQIAAELNERRIPTARGGKWSVVQVCRVLSRIGTL